MNILQNLNWLLFLTIIIELTPTAILAEHTKKEEHILYHKKDYGSAAILNPVTYYFNAAFDTIQNPWLFSQENYFKKHKIVWNRIKSPITSIKRDGGYKTFFLDEFASTRVLPNATIHLLGSGYDYRILSEWFDYHEFSYPKLLSAMTLYAAHFGNEAIESTDKKNISSHDHIADLFFFDLAAIFLFESDKISKFFHEKLYFRNWYFQPMFDLRSHHIKNAGTNYILRPKLFGDDISLFLYLGLQLMGGLSFSTDKGTYLTLAAGTALTDPITYKGRTTVGIFFDKNDSLLYSLIINGTDNLKARFNIYPGVLKFKSLRISLFNAIDHENSIYFGLNLHLPLGVSTHI